MKNDNNNNLKSKITVTMICILIGLILISCAEQCLYETTVYRTDGTYVIQSYWGDCF